MCLHLDKSRVFVTNFNIINITLHICKLNKFAMSLTSLLYYDDEKRNMTSRFDCFWKINQRELLKYFIFISTWYKMTTLRINKLVSSTTSTPFSHHIIYLMQVVNHICMLFLAYEILSLLICLIKFIYWISCKTLMDL